MNSNTNQPNNQQRKTEVDSANDAALPFGLSIALGVVTIIITVASLYFGIFPK